MEHSRIRSSWHAPQRFASGSIDTTSTNINRLFAVAIPAEQEDEKKKRRNNDNDDHHDGDNDIHENYKGNDQKDWTVTRGGFIPNILKRKKESQRQKDRQQGNDSRIQLVDNIHDYKQVVVGEKEKIVVVRFVADWCRSCKATKPAFAKLMKKTPSSKVKFVEVPLTKETEYLLNGLGVPSVPFAHVYHPDVGLVEEMKVSKPHFASFSKKLSSYVVGKCNISEWEESNRIAVGPFQ